MDTIREKAHKSFELLKEAIGVNNRMASPRLVKVVLSSGTGVVKTTGSLGDVAKESIDVAFAYVKSHAQQFGIAVSKFTSNDFHLHMPEGAVGKDGPSAGIAFVTSLISALTGKVCKPDIAMSGEVDINGNVWAVGGLREKLVAARRSNISTVFIPEGDRGLIKDIEPYLLGDLQIIFVQHVSEIIPQVFVDG